MRERVLIRAWEYRQRHTSHGAWFRIRRVLLDAAQAWTLSDQDADRLERTGHLPMPVGGELAPPKRMFFVSAEELRTLAGREPIDVRLSPQLLAAANLALIAHTSPRTSGS